MTPCSLVDGSQCLKGACCFHFWEFRSSIVPQNDCNNPGDYTASRPKTPQPFGGRAIVSSIPLQIKFYWHLIEVRDIYSRVFGSNPAADMKDNRSTLDFLENCHCLRVF